MKFYKIAQHTNLTKFEVINSFSSNGSFFDAGEIYEGVLKEYTIPNSNFLNEFEKDENGQVKQPITPLIKKPMQVYHFGNLNAIKRTPKKDIYKNGSAIWVRKENIRFI